MVFNNTLSVQDHINNKIDESVFPEEKHHILQGNIGCLIAGNSRLHATKAEAPSILGIVGDIMKPEQVLNIDNGKIISQSGKLINVPRNFNDDNSPLFFGELGFGVDWNVLNSSKNNIGYALNVNGNRYNDILENNYKLFPSLEVNEKILPRVNKSLNLGSPIQ